ncbi:MAG: hypothetical protein K0A94_08205 [Desulfuromonadales bacterium]|nr:hypothetical protein [Desulfuromonadales bacterium]
MDQDFASRLARADALKQAVLTARQKCREARKLVNRARDGQKVALIRLQQAMERLSELQSGRGEKLVSVGPATVFEFWIDVPGYSGPVRGTKSRVTQYGDFEYISNTKGTSKGGLGGALVGGALLGPTGAVVGALASRRTTVETDVEEVDNRQFELEVTGPGFAWSTVQNPDTESTLKKFRDVTNARGSNNDDVRTLASAQSSLVESLRESSSRAAAACESAAAILNERTDAYIQAWDVYTSARLPLLEDLRARWANIGIAARVGFVVCGPVVLASLIVLVTVTLARNNNADISLIVWTTALYMLALSVTFVVYLYRVRLVDSMKWRLKMRQQAYKQ